MKEYIQALSSEKSFGELIEKYQIRTVVWPTKETYLNEGVFHKTSGWQVVQGYLRKDNWFIRYKDDIATIYEKTY